MNPDTAHNIVHQFPAGECVLQVYNTTITRNIKLELQTSRTLPALCAKIIKDSQWWNEDTFDTINWPAHYRALQRHRKHRPTMIKYIHGLLPLGNRVHKYNEKYPPTCPSCGAPDEDIKHFWACPAASRLSWRRQFLRNLDLKLRELKIKQTVRTLLVSKLRAVLDGQDPERVPVGDQELDISEAQKAIGWQQLLKGRFAVNWMLRPSRTTSRTTHPAPQAVWVPEIIDFIFQQWRLLWDLRNQDRHGRDT